MKTFLGIIFFLFLSIFSFSLGGGNLITILQPAEFIMFFPSAFIICWAVSPKKSLWLTLRAIFSNIENYDQNQKILIKNCINIMGNTWLFTGFLATLIGTEITFGALKEGIEIIGSITKMDAVGHHIAASITGTCYGLFFYIICKGLEKKFE